MEEHGLEAKTITDAKKETIAGDAALDLALKATKIYVAKGKKVVEFSLRAGKPTGEYDTAEIRGAITGPTGNLRAPTLFVGKTLYVGFQPELYERLLG